MRHKSLLLRPHHFEGLDIHLSSDGLTCSFQIERDDREREISYHFDDGAGQLLEKLDVLRPYTTVILNPEEHPAQVLSKHFEAASALISPRENIRSSYGFPEEYDRQWQLGNLDELIREGQHIVLVAYDGPTPVGYAGLNVSLLRRVADAKTVDLTMNLHLVYVLPTRRGEGFGLDLSIACGMLCENLLEATYRAVPPRTVLQTYITADYESEGGERFARHLYGALEYRVDMLSEFGKRRSIILEHPELDAGY